MISRRNFIGTAVSAAGVARLASAAPLGQPIGFQSYSVRDRIGKDFEGTLKEMASLGYQSIEMCSPAGYEKAGFGGLVSRKASDLRAAVKAAGLRCESCHFQFRELKDHLDARIAWSKELGLRQMIVASMGIKPKSPLADWAAAASDMNRLGERCLKAGVQLGFHNHNMEFEQVDGKVIYDELLRVFDRKLVKLQFQVAVVSMGINPAEVVEKHPGRIVSLHLADWSPEAKKMVALGKGSVDWKRLFQAARPAGVKNYYVEMNFEELKNSVPYLRSLR